MANTTIVISNFNFAHYLDCSIRSCIDQSVDCDIIIVDDHSTDSSWDKMLSIKKEFKNCPIKCVRLKSNSGGNARGKNIGICLSKTPFITCLDSDDLLFSNSVKLREDILLKNDVSWVHGDHISFKGKKNINLEGYLYLKQRYSKNFINGKIKKITINNDLSDYRRISASTVMVKKELYLKYGLYREDLKWKIDKEMWHNLLYHKEKKAYIRANVSLYRVHPHSITHSKAKNPKVVNHMFYQICENRIKGAENIFNIKNYNYNNYIEYIEE